MSTQIKPKAEKMADFFDARAESYDKHMLQNVDSFEEFYATIAESIPPTNDEISILDLGCGTGLELSEIFKRVPNARITGIDLSENMLEQLRKKYANRSAQIILIQGSYLDLSYGENKFDYVISVMTAHHLLRAKKLEMYQKIFRSLKESGKYIEADYVISEDKELQILAKYYEMVGSNQEGADGRYHLDIPMSIKTLSELFIKAGFDISKVVWNEGEAAILEGIKI